MQVRETELACESKRTGQSSRLRPDRSFFKKIAAKIYIEDRANLNSF
jgi:hypothetical protein